MNKVKSILIIRLRKIGDIVLTTPSLVAIKELFPQAETDYIVERPYEELIENHPYIDNPIIINRDDSIFKLKSIFKKKRYDILYDMHGGPRASAISLIAKANIKVGYRHRYRGFAYDFKVKKHYNPPIHSVENQLNLVRATGYDSKIPERVILPSPIDHIKEKTENRLKNFQGKRAVIHIGAGNSFRDWGEKKYRDLIIMLLKENIIPIIIGGEDVRERGKTYETEFSGKLLNFTAKASLLEVKHLIEKSSVFFGVDSGPMHIAASTDTPIVAIFGPNIPAISGPWRKTDIYIIEKKIDCRPCNQRKCIYKDIRCQTSISVDEVFSKIKEVINER